MSYEPIGKKFHGFTELKLGELFIFHCDARVGGAEQNVKVAENAFISLGRDGNSNWGFSTLSGSQRRSTVESLGMMPEERYAEVTASYR